MTYTIESDSSMVANMNMLIGTIAPRNIFDTEMRRTYTENPPDDEELLMLLPQRSLLFPPPFPPFPRFPVLVDIAKEEVELSLT